MSCDKRKRLNSFLRNVANTSRIISQTVGGVDLPTIPPLNGSTKPPTLPSPPDILPELEATGAPTSIIMQELEKFEQGCQILRRRTEAVLCRLVRNTPDFSPLGSSMQDTSLRSLNLLENAYLKRVLDLKACTLKQVHSVSSRQSSKIRFNQESTPLLEKYFKDNAYPSSADRAMLAQKTRMTMRQIDVWFQNHRTRGRRDGIVLKRRSYNANPDEYTLESPGQETNHSAVSHRSRDSPGSSESHSEEDYEGNMHNRKISMELVSRWISAAPIDIVKTPPPPHAFPARFSPEKYDKFPFTLSLAVYEWRRKPSTTPISTSKRRAVDVDAFTDDFNMQLRIFDQPQRNFLKRKRSDDSIDFPPAPTKKVMASHPTSHSRPIRNTLQSAAQSKSIALPKRVVTTHPPKRRTTLNSRRSSSTSTSSLDSPSRSVSPGCLSSTSASGGHSDSASSIFYSALSSTSTSSRPPLIISSSPQHLLSQRLSWHTSKFVQWSSLPALTLNLMPFKIPFTS